MKYFKTYNQIKESLDEKINWKKLTDPYHWFKSKDIFQEREKNVSSSTVEQLIKATEKNGDAVERHGKNAWGITQKSAKDNEAVWQYLDGHLYWVNPNHKSVYDTLIPSIIKESVNEGTFQKEGWLVKSNDDDTKYIVLHTSEVENKSNRISTIYKDKKLADKRAIELNKNLRGIDEAEAIVRLTVKSAASFEKELKNNKISYTKESPTIFSVEKSPKAMMAIRMTKERFGTPNIIVENSDFGLIAEGVWSKIMAGVKKGEGGPWSIVATDNRKVVGQDINIQVKDLIPAHYEDMKRKYPKAKLHIEDAGGGVVWSE